MRRHHDAGSKVFITEVGWGTPAKRRNNPFAVTKKKQAELLKKTVNLLLSKRRDWNLQGVTWFTWRDFQGSGGCVWCEHAGLQTKRGKAKPALRTYRRMIRQPHRPRTRPRHPSATMADRSIRHQTTGAYAPEPSAYS